MSLLFNCADPEARSEGLTRAVRSVRSGDLVVLPTDTVYGVGADAFNREAVGRLLAAKGRGRDMPVPVLVGSWHTIDGLVSFVTPTVRSLIEAFWPGALTLVVTHAPSLAWDLGDARGTVALRMPLHPLALNLLEQTGPMAVSSANQTGKPTAQTATEAQEQLGDSVAVYLEAGQALGTVASTIVDVTGERPKLLRVGGISAQQLTEVVGEIDL
jgi:L-threonylcarbamoyladenylate synthase